MVKRYEVLDIQDYWEAEDGEFVEYDDYAELRAENAKLKEAARVYIGSSGHTARCWGLQKVQGQVSGTVCICGRDALATLLEASDES